MELRKSAHTVYKTQYHIVWATKYRRKILNEGVSEYVKLKLIEIKKHIPDIEILEIGIAKDHLHLHLIIPPKYSVSKIVNKLKSNSGRELKKKFPFLKKVYWGTESVWSKGYFVSTVGINEKIISNYVKMQGQEDSGQAKLEL